MELKTYLTILQRRKWIILIVAIISTVVATVLSLLATPQYSASTTVRVATYGSGLAEGGRTDINYSQLLMSTYASILTSGRVRGEIREELGLDSLPEIATTLVPNTELMKIRATAPLAKTAQEIANLAADKLVEESQALYSGGGRTTQEILSEYIAQLQGELDQALIEYDELVESNPDNTAALSAAAASIELKRSTLSSLLEQNESARVSEALRANSISIVEPAFEPRNPSKPRHPVNIALGLIVGLVAGVGLALLAENLDNTLYSVQQIESIAETPAVGKIPNANTQLKIVRFDNDDQFELEAFRRLRTNILASGDQARHQSLLVTSAERGEGKSTIVANLAVTLAQSGRRVVVVDCDLRRPAQQDLFNVSNKHGLTDILTGSKSIAQAVQESSFSRVEVLTTGPLPPNPTELLGSMQMVDLLTELKETYDVVLLDTPALLSVTDAAVLVPQVDKVVLVVARASSRRDALRAVRQQLNNVNAKTVNVVVNRAERNGIHSY